MTKLKIDINFNSSCILTVKDTTGYGGDGFTDLTLIPLEIPAEPSTPNYSMTNGYFINAILYHRYNGAPQLINTNEQPLLITNPAEVYANNFTAKSYTLKKDGVYSFRRLFIISKDYYLANSESITTKVFYYDATTTKYFKVDSKVTTEVELYDVVNETNLTTTGAVVSYKFISTCYLNRCLYLLQNKVLNSGYSECNSEADIYRKQRDYILMTLNVIKYLKEDGHLTEVQKTIELSDSCGMICKQIGKQTNNDCGCG